MIDTTKPLQLTDGTPVEFLRTNAGGHLVVQFRGSNGGRNFDAYTGKHVLGRDWVIQNVPVALGPVDWTKPIRTVSGQQATLVATAENGDRVVEVRGMFGNENVLVRVQSNGQTHESRPRSRGTMIVTKPYDIENIPVAQSVTYLNVYADGTVGSTKHKTFAAAKATSKYGKVRIAILAQHFRGSVMAEAEMFPTPAQLRDYGVEAHNPYASA